MAERAAQVQIDGKKSLQQKSIQVVIELLPDERPLHGGSENPGIDVAGLQRELLVRHFGDPISHQRRVQDDDGRIRRVARYHGVGELVASGELKRTAEAEFAVEIDAGGERAGDVFFLARGQAAFGEVTFTMASVMSFQKKVARKLRRSESRLCRTPASTPVSRSARRAGLP